jgi:hypothetical protein
LPRDHFHTFYTFGMCASYSTPTTPAFQSLERRRRLKTCKYCPVVNIFNCDPSVLRLEPLLHRYHCLLFRETGRHNLTRNPTIPLNDVSRRRKVCWKPKMPPKLVGDGRTVFPWNPLRRSVGKCKFHTNNALHTSPRIRIHVDGTCSFNLIVRS